MIADIIGVLGMSLLIGAYFLLLFRKIKADSYPFLFSNLFGAILLAINGIMIAVPWFYPLINMVWVTGTTYQILLKWKRERYEKRMIRKLCC